MISELIQRNIQKLLVSTMRRREHATLIFHRVLHEYDEMLPDEPTSAWFSLLARHLSERFEVISLAEAIERSKRKDLSGKTLSITFDDGYADNFDVALPILEEFRLPATFFVASGFLDGGCMWNDSITETFRRLELGRHKLDLGQIQEFDLVDWASRRRFRDKTIMAWKHLHPVERQARVDELASRVSHESAAPMMTSGQLATLSKSRFACVGGHTRNHPILASISLDEARSEIVDGKQDLEKIIDNKVDLFAYPNGKLGRDFLPEHKWLVADAGFEAAVATDWGTMGADTDLYELPRFSPWHRNISRFFLDLARSHHGLM